MKRRKPPVRKLSGAVARHVGRLLITDAALNAWYVTPGPDGRTPAQIDRTLAATGAP